MKTAIIIHGTPPKEEYFDLEVDSPSNFHWLPWIQKQLLVNNILAQTIEFPEPYEPIYEEYVKVFEQFKIDQDTTLIGHSSGAGFLLRYLTENKINVGKVVLVAPWMDPNKELETDFFGSEIDPEISNRTEKLTIFYSTDDEKEILTTVETLKNKLKDAEYKEFQDKGHFIIGTMKTDEFPELKDVLVK